MSSALKREVENNFAAFEQQWPKEMADAQKVLAPARGLFEQSYVRISSIQAWRTSIILGGVSEGAEAFFFEAQNDLLTSHCLAYCGSFRQALKSLRSALENVYFCLYYMDHAVELSKWEIGQHKSGYTELHNYLEGHPKLSGVSENLTGLGPLKGEYGPHPFRWTVSNLSFRPLILIQRIPQRSLPPQAAEVPC